jgi:hypothetical protein
MSRYRFCVLRTASIVIVLLVSYSAIAASADIQRRPVIVFEEAEFVLSKDANPPDDSAAWRPVTLPHEWRRTHPGATGQGWYRIRFNLATAPKNAQAININYASRLGHAHFFVNGALLGGSRDITASAAVAAFGTPFYVFVPPVMLRAGVNVIHTRTHTTSYPINVEGLGRITFGDARPVRRISVQHVYAGFYAGVFFLAMAFAAGLITLFAWLAYRTDRIMFWFSITCLSWALVGMLNHAVRWLDLGLLNPVLSLYVNYGLVVPAIILCLRTVGLRWRRIELVLWLFLAVQVTYPWWLDRANLFVRLGWDIVNTGLLLGGVAILLIAAKRPVGWPYRLEVSALFFMAVLMSFEVIRYLGWIDPETVSFRQYHVPVMLLAIGAAIFERHVAAIWRMQDTKVELERRVAEKTREIEANHLRVQEAMREQTLARERQRILADMHDGLGATLVGLLRHVQAGGFTTGSIEQRAREALHELRIAVDALQPNEGDIASVIGSIRSRLDELVQATGVRLEWCVDEMPLVAGLNPSTVFALQRIMLEAVTNALKHSGARTIRLLATAPDNEKVVIEIRDDGHGFESPESATGFGITNMRARSTAAGAQLQIASHPHTGTVVRLILPLKQHFETPALQSTEQPPLGLNPASSVL